MTLIWFCVLAVAVAASAGCVDYAAARYVSALHAGARHRAARWSVAQWSAASIGFVVAVKGSMWILPFEGLGLYIGTWLGTRPRGRRVDPS